jgi:hypothetical protein
MTLFQIGNFKSHSGEILSWKIECDSLTDNDWECLCHVALKVVKPFRSVEGIPRGGLKLSNLLYPYSIEKTSKRRWNPHLPHLIVDDVFTTGSSMEERRKFLERQGIEDIRGLVVFARSPPPKWIKPIFQVYI